MNYLINEEHYSEQLYQILGTESQVLQLVLMPNQQIVTSESSVQYMSEKIHLKERYTLRERFKYDCSSSFVDRCSADSENSISLSTIHQTR